MSQGEYYFEPAQVSTRGGRLRIKRGGIRRRRGSGRGGKRKTRESDFTRAIVDLAAVHGWLRTHNTDSRMCIGDNGVPDLLLCKDGRVIFAELKVPPNVMSREQVEWMRRLAACGPPVEVYQWTPADMDAIVLVLAGSDKGVESPHASKHSTE